MTTAYEFGDGDRRAVVFVPWVMSGQLPHIVWYNRHMDELARMDIGSSDDIEGILEALGRGENPIADGWEDGCGRLVCFDTARELCEEALMERQGFQKYPPIKVP